MSARPAPNQVALWYEQQLTGEHGNHHSYLLETDRGLAEDAFRRACDLLVDRHEALRSAIRWEEEGAPSLAIADRGAADADVIHLEDPDLDAARARVRDEARRPPSNDLPLRARLLNGGPDRGWVVLSVPQWALDRWSMPVLAREFCALYRGIAEGRPADIAPAGPPTGAAARERLDAMAARLAAAPLTLELPADLPRPLPRTRRCRTCWRPVDRGLRAALGDYGREHGLRPSSVITAAYQLALHRYTGQRRMLLGELSSPRPDAVGFGENVLAIDLDAGRAATFAEAADRAERARQVAERDSDVPFALLAARLAPERDARRHPVLQAAIAHHIGIPAPGSDDEPAEPIDAGMGARPLRPDSGGSAFEVTAETFWTPAGELCTLALTYNADLFLAETAGALLESVADELTLGLRRPDRPLAARSLATATDRRMLAGWRGPRRDFSHVPLVPQALLEQSRLRPDAIAVAAEDAEVTYAGLQSRVRALARRLMEAGAGPGAVVAVAAERSVELVVALHATMAAGAAYLPLDPEHPPDRIAFMLDDARPALILCQARLAAALPDTGVPVITIDGEPAAPPADPLPPVEVDPGFPAYVIYTSGSTGRPKGVEITHGALRNRLGWMQETFGLSPGDRILQKTPSSFDVSVWEFFWPVYAGARLVMARAGGHRDLAYLADVIRRERISVVHFVPSVLRLFLAEPVDRGDLRLVICSGETLPPDLVRSFLARMDCPLYNLYGPTETAVDVTWWHCVSAEAPTPIGDPIANTDIRILDGLGRTKPVGAVGEICVGGVQVGAGYRGRPRLTAERFVPDPDNPGARLYRTGDLGRHRRGGVIEYHGRADDQVKLYGNRIEPGEIEGRLTALESVRAAVVVPVRRGATTVLGACVAPAGTSAPHPADLTARLGRVLPPAMVPSVFAVVPELPLTPSGKADRAATARLLAPAAAGDGPSAPRTGAEHVVAGAFERILGVAAGPDADFFALGGDSLRALDLQEVLRRGGMDVPLSAIVATPTVGAIARAADDPAVAALVAQRAARRPDALAMRSGARKLSYADLDARADRLRSRLVRAGAGRLVGISCTDPCAAVSAALAIMRTGAAYVCLEPGADPAGSRVTSLVGDGGGAEPTVTPGMTTPPVPDAGRHVPAGALRAVAERLRWQGADEVVAALGSFAELAPGYLLSLATGAALHVPDPAEPAVLAALVDAAGAGTVLGTAEMFGRLLDGGWPGDPSARVVVADGPPPPWLEERLLARARVLWSLYGAAELGFWALAVQHHGPYAGAAGRPVSAASCRVLGADGEPVPAGVPGRLWVGDAAKTAPRRTRMIARVRGDGAIEPVRMA